MLILYAFAASIMAFLAILLVGSLVGILFGLAIAPFAASGFVLLLAAADFLIANQASEGAR
jgi:hypothetical protein